MEPNRNGVYYCGWGPHREQNTCIQFYMGNKLMCQLYVPYMYFLSSLLLSSKFLNPSLFAIGQLCLLLAISAPIFCWLCLPPDCSSKLSFVTGVCVRQHPWHRTGSLLPPSSGFRGLNSGFQACMAGAFTHWVIWPSWVRCSEIRRYRLHALRNTHCSHIPCTGRWLDTSFHSRLLLILKT